MRKYLWLLISVLIAVTMLHIAVGFVGEAAIKQLIDCLPKPFSELEPVAKLLALSVGCASDSLKTGGELISNSAALSKAIYNIFGAGRFVEIIYALLQWISTIIMFVAYVVMTSVAIAASVIGFILALPLYIISKIM